MTPEELKQAIIEFKEIYSSEFSTELSDEEASEKAKGLLQFFDCITKGDYIQ